MRARLQLKQELHTMVAIHQHFTRLVELVHDLKSDGSEFRFPFLVPKIGPCKTEHHRKELARKIKLVES